MLNRFSFAVVLLVPQFAFAAVTSTVSNGTLSITCDDTDNSITVTCVAPNVQVNGADPDSGAVACASLTALQVQGGAGNDTIDLSGVQEGWFLGLKTINVDGGDGDDHITGTPLADNITGGAGNNWIDAGVGNDTITIAPTANDLAYGNLGDDTFYLSAQNRGRYLDGGTGNDTIVVTGTDANDTLSLVVLAPDKALEGEVDANILLDGESMTTTHFENYQFSLGDGDDSATVQIPPSATLTLDGGAGNNTLSIDAQCQAGTLANSAFTVASDEGVSFDNFPSPTLVNAFAFGASEVDVADDATSASVDLDTGDACAWTAASDSDWLTIENTSGTGAATLSLTLTQNDAATARTGHVSVNGTNVSVVQAGAGAAENPPVTPSGSLPSTSNAPSDGNTPPPAATTTTTSDTATSAPAKRGCAATNGGAALALLGCLLFSGALRKRRNAD